ncbi:ATP-dependent helicase BRM-like [Aristolochia californica]|uniref:ATP-dependent helicase BRM-like n=1 Tax=Aristolochia californica TaxID=171875 RepID=UPI0035DF7303
MEVSGKSAGLGVLGFGYCLNLILCEFRQFLAEGVEGMQAGGGPGRTPVVGPGARSSSASPSSSSSAVSAPHIGFEAIQQQQQQLSFRQSLQQQQLRKSEGDEALLTYQAGGLHGVIGGTGGFPSSSEATAFPQQSRKFMDLSQQQGSSQFCEENQNKVSGPEQHAQNAVRQAYLQYAFQAAQQKAQGNALQQQTLGRMLGPSAKDQEMRMNNLKMQELMSLQAANQGQLSNYKKPTDHFGHGEKQMDQGQTSELRPPQANMMRPPLQVPQGPPGIQNLGNNQFAVAQLQAMQAWALENNIDLSSPANANLIAQLLPLWQSKIVAMQKPNDIASPHQPQVPIAKQQNGASSSPSGNDNTPHGGSSSDVKTRQTPQSGPFSTVGSTSGFTANNVSIPRHPMGFGNGMPTMHPPQSPACSIQNMDHLPGKGNTFTGPETLQVQYMRQLQQLNRPASQPNISSGESPGGHMPPQGSGSVTQMPQQRMGFTKQQLHVLKAQILAFRRLKRGEGSLPQEVLRAIAPPPLDPQLQQNYIPPVAINQDRNPGKTAEEHVRHLEVNDKAPQSVPLSKGPVLPKEEPFGGDEKGTVAGNHLQGPTTAMKEPIRVGSVAREEQSLSTTGSVKSEQETEQVSQKAPVKSDSCGTRGKSPLQQVPTSDAAQVKQPPPQKDVASTRKYYGPLFDFPYFTRRHDSFGSSNNMANSSNLTLAYDIKDLLYEEGIEVLTKKREENLKKIGGLLAVNLERKRIRPDLVLRLQIEERKLRLLDLQARLRDEVDQQQQVIMAMPDRHYRKFVRLCERQRLDLVKQVQLSQKVVREKQLKSIFQWRKKLLEAHWAIRDARTARNRGVAKYHERMLREFSKRKDEDRNKRMEALKNNDVDRYREMLLEQQTNMPGDAAQRYSVLSSFLSQTEDYLHKLGGKITAAKSQQEVEEAANAAVAAARSQGLSEEEVRAAAACAGREVMIRNRFSEMNAPMDSSSVNKYYNLAHAVNEKVIRQPSMLRTGTLRDYQIIGLQWMLSLYNNKLNGILADEMGLGKTVQVMALIAYLMEFKGNYGPHLIIVPNAVLVNWKSELHSWLPSVSCIFYVGSKDQRSRLFSQEVCALKFNVLVTTYEFIMYDRTKLSKVDWKYIIIDEAQRMKDRESVLARDLDRYRCQRRLLLTGTPLQNDLKELWSLLNLLLPEVFDNRKAFHDWFSKPFQKDGSSESVEDDWLETEKKVIVIHRLHQILEPFMLRRRVEDVEGSLPPKIPIVLRCKMSDLQGAIYDWIKSTGTIRVDPEDELRRVEKNPMYQIKTYKNLNNKCMELRKACNHPLLNYPYFSEYSTDFIVRSCGKLWVLDRILIKLQRTGHRVLLFSTMTKLLDILEEYLQWRRLVYRRIDGTTCLEERESAIVDFNSPDSGCFIFLLSIRAAGRGLNLQTADTVIIYDPDPNPKNEEQAVARAHRIGQKREVRVIYMEAVVDKISSHQKEDELRSGGVAFDLEDDLAGKDRYIGSIESLIRNNIQQYKIEMADEVINAGRFDQRTTHEERRMTLEALLHDEERYQENVHDVPSLQEVNRMIARSEEEVELFDQMDEEFDWAGEMIRYDQVPKWLSAGTREVNALISNLSKKSLKGGLGGVIGLESVDIVSDSQSKPERRRGRPTGSKKFSYQELDDENGEDSEASSEERKEYGLNEEEGEIAEFEEEDFSGAVDTGPSNKDQSEEEGPLCGDGVSACEFTQIVEGTRIELRYEEAASSGSSSESRRLAQVATTISGQKFGSLSALDARPGSLPKRMPDELEEGEIAVSGDSHMDIQQSGSWIHERDDGEEEQVLQPKIKRKRSIRVRHRYNLEKHEEKSNNEKVLLQRGVNTLHADSRNCDIQIRADSDAEACSDTPVSDRHVPAESVSKQRRNLSSRKGASSMKWVGAKPTKLSSGPGNPQDVAEYSRETWDGKANNVSGQAASYGSFKMTEIVQRKCKNVCSKFQRRISKDGHEIAPQIVDFWKRTETLAYKTVNNYLDLQKIDQNVEKLHYSGVMDFVLDVQLMLKSSVQYCGFSYEVRMEARKLQDIFFDILKIAFPDTDFREVRNSISFLGPGPTATASPKQVPANQTKRHKLVNEVEQDPGTRKLSPRGPIPAGDDSRFRSQPPKFQKESRLASTSARDLVSSEAAPFLTHPGELVICKKKRKDRDKVPVKPRSGPTSPVSTGRNIRVVPTRSTQQNHGHPHNWASPPSQPPPPPPLPPPPPPQPPPAPPRPHSETGVVKGAQWAKPVKRLRTDTGKRRPSHL